MGAYVARRIDRGKGFRPTGIMGPSKWIGGRTKAQWATRMPKGVSHYIPDNLSRCLPCDTSFNFHRRRGSASDEISLSDAH